MTVQTMTTQQILEALLADKILTMEFANPEEVAAFKSTLTTCKSRLNKSIPELELDTKVISVVKVSEFFGQVYDIFLSAKPSTEKLHKITAISQRVKEI